MDEIENLDETLSLERTDKLFDSAITRGESHKEGTYSEEDIKKQRLVIGFGNLHINTAKTKISVARMRGYRDQTEALKRSVDRKIRNERKYPESEE